MKSPDCQVCASMPGKQSCGGHWSARPAHCGPGGSRRVRVSLDTYDAAHLADYTRYDYEEREDES